MRSTAALIAMAISFLSAPSMAATVIPVSGSILVNTGDGFTPLSGRAEVNVGDRVLVRGEGMAKIVYGEDCVQTVPANQSATVISDPPCDKAGLTPSPDETLVVGGVVILGGAAAVALSGGKDDGPASP